MKHPYFKSLSVFLLCLTLWLPAAQAQTLDKLDSKDTYQIRWNGIGIGRVIINIKETDTRYDVSVDTKTRGIVDVFTPLRSYISAHGRISPDGRYVPRLYKSRSQSSGGGRNVELRFDDAGALNERIRDPLDDPSWRPEVPLTALQDASDPLTGFLRFRKEFFSNLIAKKEETIFKLYDGRRLGELRVKAISPTTRMIDDAIIRVINTVLFRAPIDGYTPKELAKWEEGDPTVHIYFTEDSTLMPLEISIHLRFGSITATREDD